MPSPAETVLRERYPAHEWRPATPGHSGSLVYRLTGEPGLYVKIADPGDTPDSGAHPTREAARLHWLTARGVPCPEVVDTGEIEESQYLVTTALPGRPASDPWPVEQRMTVVDAIAGFLTGFHSLPTRDCPFDRRLRVTVPMAKEIAALGELDPAWLDPRRRGWSVSRLVTELVAAARLVGREEVVVCHGDYCLPNVLLDPETFRVTGVVDVGRLGVADRYQDLALVTRSLGEGRLNPQFGGEYGARFMYRYGEIPADADRVELYRLLDEFF